MPSALYVFLQLLADYFGLAYHPKIEVLTREGIDFCVRFLREQFHLCLKWGEIFLYFKTDLLRQNANRYTPQILL